MDKLGPEYVICIDAKPSKGRPTGLRQNGRYVVYSWDEPSLCCYCHHECSKINVGFGATWCASRFARSLPGEDLQLKGLESLDPDPLADDRVVEKVLGCP